MTNKDIENACKVAKIYTATVTGMGPTSAMSANAFDHTEFAVRLNVNMKHPSEVQRFIT